MMDKRDELIVRLVDEINPRVDSHQYDLVVEALECVGYPVKVIMDYLSGDAVLGTVQPDTPQPAGNSELAAAVLEAYDNLQWAEQNLKDLDMMDAPVNSQHARVKVWEANKKLVEAVAALKGEGS